MAGNRSRIQLTPDVVARFAAYYRREPVWGSLHVVLDEGNIGDGSVERAREWAVERGDSEGEALAGLLMLMSPSQRGRLAAKVYQSLRGV